MSYTTDQIKLATKMGVSLAAGKKDAVKNYRGAMKSNKVANDNFDKLIAPLTSQASNMGSKKYNKAYRTAKKMARSGNLKGAREYIQDQVKRVSS